MHQLFSLNDQLAIVTGGTGVLGSAMAHGLAQAGAIVGVLGRRSAQAQSIVQEINAGGGRAFPLVADVLDQESLTAARQMVLDQVGRVNILINCAGGNVPGATIVGDLSFFDMTREAYEQVMALNLTGTVLPSQIFGQVMADQQKGVIVNISSMTAQRPLTRVLGYGNAKAAVDNYTKWLAVELAQKYGPELRVNAIAPGFFIGEQNRSFLLQEDGQFSPRGQQIIDHTPFGRFGEPDELAGTAVWLCSDAARFVTGVVVPVDGGFSAFSGI